MKIEILIKRITKYLVLLLWKFNAYSDQEKQNNVANKNKIYQSKKQNTDTNNDLGDSIFNNLKKKLYGSIDTSYRAEDTLKNEPGSTSMAGDSKYRLLLNFSIGYGPIRFWDFQQNFHYQYSQNWETDYNQVTLFKNKWFSKPKMENFIFPTNSLLRTHSFVTDLRYLNNKFQLGLFSRLSLGRIGSRILGEKLETSETAAISEQFVPYAGIKLDRYYRGEFSMPFKTELNKQDPRLSNSTYSWSSKGRGRVFSYQLRNAGFVPKLSSIFYLDIFMLQYRFASIFEDKSQTGFTFAVDSPIWWKFRTKPKLQFFKDNYVVERTRIPGFEKGSSLENNNPAELKKRVDTSLTIELALDYTISPTMKIEVYINKGEKKSSIAEYNLSNTLFGLNYVYALPTLSISQRKVQRFQENTFTSEF